MRKSSNENSFVRNPVSKSFSYEISNEMQGQLICKEQDYAATS